MTLGIDVSKLFSEMIMARAAARLHTPAHGASTRSRRARLELPCHH